MGVGGAISRGLWLPAIGTRRSHQGGVSGVGAFPPFGRAGWDGFAPEAFEQLITTIVPAAGGATWDGLVPEVLVGDFIMPPVGEATWEGFAPTVATEFVAAGETARFDIDSLTGTLSDGDNITALADTSPTGLGFDLTGTTQFANFETGEVNGLPIARFVNSGDRLHRTSADPLTLFSASEGSIYIVYKEASNHQGTLLRFGTNPNYVIVHNWNDGKFYFDWANNTTGRLSVNKPATGYFNVFHVLACIRRGSESVLRLDGTELAAPSISTSLSTATDTFRLGWNGVTNNGLAGDIAYVITANEGHDDTDAAAVEGFLADRFGL